jgi:hypothetical protein
MAVLEFKQAFNFVLGILFSLLALFFVPISADCKGFPKMLSDSNGLL